eukprot:4838954-Prymnesium_polylepis.1
MTPTARRARSRIPRRAQGTNGPRAAAAISGLKSRWKLSSERVPLLDLAAHAGRATAGAWTPGDTVTALHVA